MGIESVGELRLHQKTASTRGQSSVLGNRFPDISLIPLYPDLKDASGFTNDIRATRIYFTLRNIITQVDSFAEGQSGDKAELEQSVISSLNLIERGLESDQYFLFAATSGAARTILKADLRDTVREGILGSLEKAIAVSSQNHDNLARANSLINIAEALLDSEDPKQQMAGAVFIGKYLDRTANANHTERNPDLIRKMGTVIGNNLEDEDQEISNSAYDLAEIFLAVILSDQSSHDLINYWKNEKIWDDRRNLKINLRALSTYEALSPGIAGFMVDVIGMKYFSIVSYPTNVFKEEFEYLQQKYEQYKAHEGDEFDPWEEERRILESYELNSDKFLSAWKEAQPRYLARAVRDNISVITQLEKKRPGITKRLNNDFFIRYFARYPEELLIRQYDEIEANLPYAIALFPRVDRTGAFANRIHFLEQLSQQFPHLLDEDGNEHRYALRVAEVGSTFDIGRLGIGLRNKYEKFGRKIASAIPGTHGNIDYTHWGADKPINYVSSSDLLGKGFRRIGEFFEPNPTIVFASCKTGTPEGIAQRVSEVIDGTTVAPDTSTRIQSVSAAIRKGRLVFTEVVYRKPKSKRIYVSGKEKV